MGVIRACFGEIGDGTQQARRSHVCANRQVEMDSAVCARSAETVATMTVRQFPPRLSRSTEVIMELRYCLVCGCGCG